MPQSTPARLPDVLTSILAFVFIALPGFWISDLIVIGLVKFTNAPILGTQTYGIDFPNILSLWLDRFWHLALPAMVLSIGGIAAQSRYIRASMIETMREDYIRTAFAKGLAQEAVFYKHALRNSIRPLITGIGGLLPGLIGGSIIIETIFAYPGLGRLGYEAVLERDYPTLVALNFIVAALVLLGNLIVRRPLRGRRPARSARVRWSRIRKSHLPRPDPRSFPVRPTGYGFDFVATQSGSPQ